MKHPQRSRRDGLRTIACDRDRAPVNREPLLFAENPRPYAPLFAMETLASG